MSSYFGNAIKLVLEERKLSQKALADLAEIDAGVLSRYVSGAVRPGRDVLEKLCRALPANRHRASIVIAHLRDETPPTAAELIQILNLVEDGYSVVQEPTSAVKLPAKARKDFEFLMAVAESRPEVIEWIKATVDVLRDR